MKLVANFLVLLACITPLVAQEQSEATARAQVVALEKAWNQAYKTGDAAALASILDNSLVLVEDDGTLKTKAEFLSSLKAPTTNEEQVSPRIAERARLWQYRDRNRRSFGEVRQNGKPVIRHERFIDTWVYRNGAWMCIATDATPMTHSAG